MSQVTKAAILAAGRGTRMKELTDELPKPMVAVKGKPILESIVSGLVANGVEKILIVIGYRKEVITDYFGDGSAFGCEISYVEQVVQVWRDGAELKRDREPSGAPDQDANSEEVKIGKRGHGSNRRISLQGEALKRRLCIRNTEGRFTFVGRSKPSIPCPNSSRGRGGR